MPMWSDRHAERLDLHHLFGCQTGVSSGGEAIRLHRFLYLCTESALGTGCVLWDRSRTLGCVGVAHYFIPIRLVAVIVAV